MNDVPHDSFHMSASCFVFVFSLSTGLKLKICGSGFYEFSFCKKRTRLSSSTKIDLVAKVSFPNGRGSRVAGRGFQVRVVGFKKVAGFEKVAGFQKIAL